MGSRFARGSLLLATLLVACHGRADGGDVLDRRAEAMKQAREALRAVDREASQSGDPVAVSGPARALREFARTLPALFPPGSAGPYSDALPLIWDEWERFVQAADALGQAARAIEGAASAQALAQGYERMLDACKSCHGRYRMRR